MNKQSFLFEFYSILKSKWLPANIEVEHLQVLGIEEKLRVRFNKITLYIDGEPCNKFIWNNNNEISITKFFDIVINSYLTSGTSFRNFNDEWKIFNNIQNSFKKENNLITVLPFYDKEIQLYDLELATPKYRFYHTIDEYLIINTDGKIITDKENYYKSILYRTLLNICNDAEDMNYIYSRDTKIDAVIEEYGQEVGLILGGHFN